MAFIGFHLQSDYVEIPLPLVGNTVRIPHAIEKLQVIMLFESMFIVFLSNSFRLFGGDQNKASEGKAHMETIKRKVISPLMLINR